MGLFHRRCPRVRAAVFSVFLAAWPASALAQTPSDTCAAAANLSPSTTVTGTTSGATSDLPQTCGLGDSLDVWYRFKAPVTATYNFDTNGSFIDTVLAVFADCNSLGSPIACNDDDPDATDFSSRVAVNLAANQVVRIRVAANVADEGFFNLRVSGGTPPPANDECSGEIPALFANTAFSGNSEAATTSVTIPNGVCGDADGSGGGADVFFRFTPLIAGQYAILSCGSAYDTVLSVHSGCPATPANLLACNDDAEPSCSLNSVAAAIRAVTLEANRAYYIRLAGFDNLTGPYTIVITVLSVGTGACCRGAECVIIAQAACISSNSRFVGLGSTCNPPGNNSTPCCRADFNKVGGVSIQDVFDFLSAYFTNQPTADANDSGTVTVQDVFDYLVAYFAGPC